ncbi:MAG: hypothetical protein JWN78_592 [Bacteroidota bacterium]|nr:hypothetical protein [Bacteroidota bacterium]
MIKKILEKAAKYIAGSRVLLKPFTPLIYLSNHIQANKQKTQPETIADPILVKHLGAPVVKNGPFKGLVYPSYQSVGSTIFPKIIGSYEAELHQTIEAFIQKNFDIIIDIGCAEGYYAIGFALKNKNAKIYAYDTDETARILCDEMSKLNHVEGRISIKNEFTPDSFKEIDPSKKTLLICDCEGYEAKLFNADALPYIKDITLLIETHDFIDPEISINLQKLLAGTHKLEIVQTIDDLLKAKYYKYPELESLTLQQRKEILQEKRPAIMEWIIASPKFI